MELKSRSPYIAVLRELMFDHECDNITSFLGPYLGFPPGRMSSKGGGKNDWTMKKYFNILIQHFKEKYFRTI